MNRLLDAISQSRGMVIHVCAWCGLIIRFELTRTEGVIASHGMCEECKSEFMRKLRERRMRP